MQGAIHLREQRLNFSQNESGYTVSNASQFLLLTTLYKKSTSHLPRKLCKPSPWGGPTASHPKLMLASIWFQLPSDIGGSSASVPSADMSQSWAIINPLLIESPVEVPGWLYMLAANMSSVVLKKFMLGSVVVA